MDSSAISPPSTGRRRGRYSDFFKVDIVASCKAPGVSTATMALANSLNANLVRRWVAESGPEMTRAPKQQAALPPDRPWATLAEDSSRRTCIMTMGSHPNFTRFDRQCRTLIGHYSGFYSPSDLPTS